MTLMQFWASFGRQAKDINISAPEITMSNVIPIVILNVLSDFGSLKSDNRTKTTDMVFFAADPIKICIKIFNFYLSSLPW